MASRLVWTSDFSPPPSPSPSPVFRSKEISNITIKWQKNSTLTADGWTVTFGTVMRDWTGPQHIKTAEQRTIIQQYGDWYTGRWWAVTFGTATQKPQNNRPLYSNTVTGTVTVDGWAVLHLVQRGEAWAGWGPAQAPYRCTEYNSPPINSQCTNFILFNVTL